MTIVFSAFAWAFKNWKLVLVALAITTIFTLGYKLRAAYDAYEQVETLKRRLGALQITAKHDAARVAADAKTIAELERKASETPPNTGACLDRDAARRVRAIR
jgi:hypothetical protein